jgi:hypothetical protein
MLREYDQIRTGFEFRLREEWGDALDALETLSVAAMEAGSYFQHRQAAFADRVGDPLLGVLLHLHALACQIASECWSLLASGHAHGAHARWRSLHETAVTMEFIRLNGTEMAERFVAHEAVDRADALKDYQRYAKELGEAEFDAADTRAIEAERDAVAARFEPGFIKPYGWAAPAVRGRPSFRAIEEATNLAHLRPRYRWASGAVHPVPTSLVGRLGGENPRIMLAGPSNTGLADPGMDTAVSLFAATAALLDYRSDMNAMIHRRVLAQLVDDAIQAFYETGVRVDAMTEENLRADLEGVREVESA